MSKAFTRETDDAPEPPTRPRSAAAFPPGTKNYLTEDGAGRLRRELAELSQVERPRIAATPEDPEVRRRLLQVDQRIQCLHEVLVTAVVVPSPGKPWEQVRFGASVTVRDRNGEETRYRIVGVAETDPERGWVSWLSPIAKVLLNARLGQRVRFQFPSGEEELEIIRLEYE